MLSANVGIGQNTYVATLSDGRSIVTTDMNSLAQMLVSMKVNVRKIGFEWRPGQRMMTAGQQAALAAELRFQSVETTEISAAA